MIVTADAVLRAAAGTDSGTKTDTGRQFVTLRIQYASKEGSGGLKSRQEENVRKVRLTQNLGMLLLAIWLILSGLIALLSLSFQGLGLIMALLAIAAGVLILIGR